MKITIASLAAVAALGCAATAQARPTCGDSDAPCPTPTQDRGNGTATGIVNVNNGYSLTVRKRPSPSSRAVRKVADGSRVRIVCQTRGPSVTGKYGTSRIWDKLAHGGYVSDAYIYTGTDGRVAKDCKTRKAAPSPNTSGARPPSIKLRNDYPFKQASWNDADPWAFYKRECTSFVAYRLNKVMKFSNRMRGGHFGNAENWDENARALGFSVNTHPTVGSVLVRNSGTYGHVAMVAKVGRGRVFVEQYNAGGTHRYSKEWLTVTGEMTFIHFRT